MATVAIPTDLCKTLTADLYGDSASDRTPTTPALQPLPEAAFSLTVKGTIGGHEAMLTIRGQDPQTFHANVAAVRGMLDAAPVQVPAAQLPAQPTAPAAPAETPEGWCAVHNVQMLKQSNQRGSWWSHKTLDGWCKGK